jgi:DNA-binding NarL/FixJ family response regulator
LAAWPLFDHLGDDLLNCCGYPWKITERSSTVFIHVEAVALYQEAMRQGNPYQAVILDLTIPGGLGSKETAEQLLAIDPTAWLIFSSGYSNDPIMANYQAFSFSGAIAKPYTMEKFQAVLDCRPPRVCP